MTAINPAFAIAQAAAGVDVTITSVDAPYRAAVQVVIDAGGGNAGLAALEAYRQSGIRPAAIVAQLSSIAPDATDWPREPVEDETGDASDEGETAPKDSTKDVQANALIEIASEHAQLFHDQGERPYARFQAGGVDRTREVSSRDFKNFIRSAYYELTGKPPGSEPLSQALGVIEAQALFDGSRIELANRVARHDDGSIYYDVGDGRAVRIVAGDWKVVADPPTLFRHYSHQLPQVLPERGGSLDAIFSCVNVRLRYRLLLKAWLVAAFIPDIPHAIPDIHGSKGSGKSIGTRALRRVIDPSSVETLSLSGSDKDLIQRLDHHYVSLFDNVGSISARVSDILCRAVTGAGHTDRALYSNDDDFTRAFRRVVMLNGINVAAQRPDLLDREILFELERIDPAQRREERELWEEFEAQLPSIMGAVFDTMAKAMAIYDGLELPRLNRMADFTRWGAAIAEALGEGAQTFIDDYDKNLEIQTKEAVEADLVGQAVLELMDGTTEWSGTPTELLSALEDAGEAASLFKRQKSGKVDVKGWPGGSNMLSRRLNEISSNLRDIGIELDSRRLDDRTIFLRRIEKPSRDIGSTDGTDGSVSTDGGSAPVDANTDATVGTVDRNATLGGDDDYEQFEIAVGGGA